MNEFENSYAAVFFVRIVTICGKCHIISRRSISATLPLFYETFVVVYTGHLSRISCVHLNDVAMRFLVSCCLPAWVLASCSHCSWSL